MYTARREEIWVSQYVADITRVNRRTRWQYQVTLVADYRNESTGEVRRAVKSFSKKRTGEQIYNWRDIKSEMIDEAIAGAQGVLGGSNWVMIRLRTTYGLVARYIRARIVNKPVRGKTITRTRADPKTHHPVTKYYEKPKPFKLIKKRR